MSEALLFEKDTPGASAAILPPCDVPQRPPGKVIPRALLSEKPPDLPEVSEVELVRHYTRLAQRNWCVDTTFYPLGSCTMKYSPKRHERLAALAGFTQAHPLAGDALSQGLLRLMWELGRYLGEIAGLPNVSLEPAAGAQGELTGLLMIAAFYRERDGGGDLFGGETRAATLARRPSRRNTVLIPDSAHGTNPASAHIAGFRPVTVASDARGNVDLEDLARNLGDTTAALMITNPNTLGLFDERIGEVVAAVHRAGALVYLDGANMNALLGLARPGDFGVDLMHFNTHKTFSTPHGSGGPGAGPIACTDALAPFLPVPIVVERQGAYSLEENRPFSIGRVHAFCGNVGVLVRAYAYLRTLGADGLKRASQHAVLNANYLLARLRERYDRPYDRPCMHEFVLSASRQAAKGVRAIDIAKRLLDYGFHPPTIYFPLIVPEALMIEPTETESRQTLDAFAEALMAIADEAEKDPASFAEAPRTTALSRLDEVAAARRPNVRWRPTE